MSDPIFKLAFGQDWQKLPQVMKRHYANRPFCQDRFRVCGRLDVFCKPPISWLAPLLWAWGTVPPANADKVPVTVDFESYPQSAEFGFNRLFEFDQRRHRFHSRMYHRGNGEMVEVMKFGFCWRHRVSWDGHNVHLTHNGYGLHLFGHMLPLPITFLVGRGDGMETPVSEDSFDMQVTIRHWLFGAIYGYAGRFEFVDAP